jgi:hypothetical protein
MTALPYGKESDQADEFRPACCARATTGHVAAAAPPSSVMKSRRLI